MRRALRVAASVLGRRAPRSRCLASDQDVDPARSAGDQGHGLPPNLREIIRSADGVTYWATDAKARRELGYAPRGLETGLRQTSLEPRDRPGPPRRDRVERTVATPAAPTSHSRNRAGAGEAACRMSLCVELRQGPDQPSRPGERDLPAAGLGDRAEVRDDLMEWDTVRTRAARPRTSVRAPGWNLWNEGVPAARRSHRSAPGRTRHRRGRVGRGRHRSVAHGHLLRILAARWISLEPSEAQLALGTATISVLGFERETRSCFAGTSPADRRWAQFSCTTPWTSTRCSPGPGRRSDFGRGFVGGYRPTPGP